MTETTDTTHCHNCGAAVTYLYCPICGQETRLHVPSAGEFLHEFIGHYIAFEGKLWQSLILLMFKPGRLTFEYLAGRRVRYVQPLRLYLTFSLLFFLAFKWSTIIPLQIDDKPVAAASAKVKTAPGIGAGAKAGAVAGSKARVPSGDEEEMLIPGVARDSGTPGVIISKIDAHWEDKLEHFQNLPGTEKTRVLTDTFFNYGPYAMFCLMPLFAVFLKLLYLGSGRRYGEHLLFALHTNAFAFLMLSIMSVAQWVPVELLLWLWLIIYMPMAMRRVYGGGRIATGVRWIVLMTLHVLGMAGAIGACYWLTILK